MNPHEDNLIDSANDTVDTQLQFEKTFHHGATSEISSPVSGLYSVILCEAGGNKIAVIKVIRDTNPELGLAEAKRLVESSPFIVAERKPRVIAHIIKGILEEAGAMAKLQPSPTGFHLAREVGTTHSTEVNQSDPRFTVILEDSGDNKIAVIKAVREIQPRLGLADAKKLVDSTPVPVSEDASELEAEHFLDMLKKVQATVRIVPTQFELSSGRSIQTDELQHYLAKYSKQLFEHIELSLRIVIDRLEQIAGADGENAVISSGVTPALETCEMKSIENILARIEGMSSSYNVILREIGYNIIPTIKAIRQHGPGLSEARQMVTDAPCVVMENAPIHAAKRLEAELVDVGAKVSIRGHFTASKRVLIRQTIGVLHNLSGSIRLSGMKDLSEAIKEQSINPYDALALIEWKFVDAIEAELSRLENELKNDRQPSD